jgi:hypothetical protein
MTTALFAGGFWLVRAWTLRRAGRLAWGRALGISLIMVAGPVLLFQGIMGLTDPIQDRPENPFGFFTYRAYWHSVFLPVQGPMADAWRRFAWKWIVPDMEGFSYTGLVVTVVAVLSIVRMVRYVRAGHYGRVLHTALPGQMGPALGAGILLLLLSMAWPFTMGLQGLVDLLGPLRQFRSLGRFAWVFYYVGALYAAWYLYVAGRRLRMKGLGSYAWAIWGVALVFWTWEGQIHLKIHTQAAQKTRDTNVINGKKAYDSGAWMLANGINPRDYQAILPLPVFNIGSEKFIPQFHTPDILRQAIKVSYDTGLPMLCGAMSRTSLHQAGNLIQVTGDMLLRRAILDDLQDRRPLLVLRQNATPMGWGDQALLAYARLLVRTEAFSWYALDLSVLEGTRQEVLTAFEARKDSLYPAGPLLVNHPVNWYIFDGFDSGPLSAFGAETRRAPAGKLVLYDGPVQDTSALDLSVWTRINRKVPGMPALYVREYTPDGAQVQAPDVSGMFTTNIVGEWARIAQTIQPRTPGNRLLIYLEDHDIEAESFLLMPTRTQTYMRMPGDTVLMYNNFYLAR